jgi:hypothetical protein
MSLWLIDAKDGVTERLAFDYHVKEEIEGRLLAGRQILVCKV